MSAADGFPRRGRLGFNTPAEVAIREAMRVVEAMGADPQLTDAVISLGDALEYVADYVDRKLLLEAKQ